MIFEHSVKKELDSCHKTKQLIVISYDRDYNDNLQSFGFSQDKSLISNQQISDFKYTIKGV